jgi:hypothetical protein
MWSGVRSPDGRRPLPARRDAPISRRWPPRRSMIEEGCGRPPLRPSRGRHAESRLAPFFPSLLGLSGQSRSRCSEPSHPDGRVGGHQREGPAMSDVLQQATGGCYCGRVRYRARGVSRQVTECHCSQCRKAGWPSLRGHECQDQRHRDRRRGQHHLVSRLSRSGTRLLFDLRISPVLEVVDRR